MLYASNRKSDVYFHAKEQIHVRCVELLMNCLLQHAPRSLLRGDGEETIDDSMDKTKNDLVSDGKGYELMKGSFIVNASPLSET